MKEYIANMIQEHAQLVVRINELKEVIYSNNGLNVYTDIENNKTQDQLFYNMSEYANRCMQLMSMRSYKKALECRLNNAGIVYSEGEYLERVGKITKGKAVEINSDIPKHEPAE